VSLTLLSMSNKIVVCDRRACARSVLPEHMLHLTRQTVDAATLMRFSP
jgi:hypothetical protein